ncbi:MAG: flagellar motor protein MotB, partial [Gammaproteobacteria bacterium]
MSPDNEKPIIMRRIKKIKKAGHHGGSWKIAYADFVTAMMTFFLLMWLLSLMNKYQLEGVAEYFRKPLKEAFIHESNQRNKDKNQDKDKAKQTEREQPPQPLQKLKDTPKIETKKTIESQGQVNGDAKGIKANTGESFANMPEKKQSNTSENNSMLIYRTILPTQKDEQGKSLNKNQNDNMLIYRQIGTAPQKPATPNEIKSQIENDLKKDPQISQFKNQLNFIVTADGLKIQLHDLENKPMFSTGKADFQSYAQIIL